MREETAAASGPQRTPLVHAPYLLVSVLLGLVLGWVPWLFHGPHPSKFSVLYMHGPIAVWSFYLSRMLIGLWIGISTQPRAWYLRGPMCGFLALLPVTFVALANPHCGFT